MSGQDGGQSPEYARALDTAVRLALLRSFIETGWPLTLEDLSSRMPYQRQDIAGSLTRLHDRRALVLFPDSYDVEMQQPFSAVPTPFRVEAQGRSWWAACAWCAFGIAALLHSPATIYTVCEHCQRPIQWEVDGATVTPSSGLVHFGLPPRAWWADLAGACVHILAFHSMEHVDKWAEEDGTRGETASPEQVLSLAHAWFGDMLEPRPRPKTPAAMAAMVAHLGLVGEFWTIPA